MVDLFYASEVYVPYHLFGPMKELLKQMAVDDLNISENAVIATFKQPESNTSQSKPSTLEHPAKRMRTNSTHEMAAKLSSMGVLKKIIPSSNAQVANKSMPIKSGMTPYQAVQMQSKLPMQKPTHLKPATMKVSLPLNQANAMMMVSNVVKPIQSSKSGVNVMNSVNADNERGADYNPSDQVTVSSSLNPPNQKNTMNPSNPPIPLVPSNQSNPPIQLWPSNQSNSMTALQQPTSSIPTHQAIAANPPIVHAATVKPVLKTNVSHCIRFV